MAYNRCERCGQYFDSLCENGFCLGCTREAGNKGIELKEPVVKDKIVTDSLSNTPFNNNEEKINSIGRVIKGIGVIIILLSLIGGLILGGSMGIYSVYGQTYNWGVALITMFGGSFYGLMIIAIGEIILLLQGNNNKLDALLKTKE